MQCVFCCDFKYCDNTVPLGFWKIHIFQKPKFTIFSPQVFGAVFGTLKPNQNQNVCLQQCQTSMRKANFIWYVFKSACQFHYSSENGFKKCLGRRGGILRVCVERVGGGRSRRPRDIPSRLSHIHLPPWATTPTAQCPLLYGTPAAPPLLPSSSLPQSCPGDTLCLHLASGAQTRAIPTPPSPYRAVEGNRFGKPEPWLCCWTALRSRQPTSACSAAGSRGGGRNARSAKVHLLLCSVIGVIEGAADQGVGVGVLVVLFDCCLLNFCCLSGNLTF